MAYTIPPLAYAYAALEPTVDEQSESAPFKTDPRSASYAIGETPDIP